MGYIRKTKGNRTTTQNRGPGNLNKTTIRDGARKPRGASGITTSISSSNAGTYRNTTTNNCGVITRSRKKLLGSSKPMRKTRVSKTKYSRTKFSGSSVNLSFTGFLWLFGFLFLLLMISR